MIEKFTFENNRQVYQCEWQVTGKRDLRQIIYVGGIGSKRDTVVYGASKHSAVTMISVAHRIACEIINGI